MEDVLSRAWAQVKWEEDVASRAKAQQKQDQKVARQDRNDRDERSSQKPKKDQGGRNGGRYMSRPLERVEEMSVSTWPDISHLSVSQPELIKALRQMGPKDKWPPKMRAPDSFQNPELWCEFHRDHGHKTEDCIALKIEFNELLGSKSVTAESMSEIEPLNTDCPKAIYTYPNRPQTSSSMAIGPHTSQAQSLRSDRARTWLGRYVATELKPSSVTT
ncbi:hypothetical protein F2Q70_00026053 [Brassica cretica]|nr:hypothetical protein F2Q70_00026053 [Brassica cretica]